MTSILFTHHLIQRSFLFLKARNERKSHLAIVLNCHYSHEITMIRKLGFHLRYVRRKQKKEKVIREMMVTKNITNESFDINQ